MAGRGFAGRILGRGRHDSCGNFSSVSGNKQAHFVTILKGNVLKEDPFVSAVFLHPACAPDVPDGFGCFELVDGK
jgi:hypothetical protein